jgi:hypothetical protein
MREGRFLKGFRPPEPVFLTISESNPSYTQSKEQPIGKSMGYADSRGVGLSRRKPPDESDSRHSPEGR